MRTYTVEIRKDLSERVEDTIEEIKRAIGWLVEENEIDESMDKHDIGDVLEYDGTLHQIIEGEVPIANYDLDALFFVHKRELLDAFHDAGIGTVDEVLNNSESFGRGLEGVAIFCYIEQKVNDWIHDDLEDWFIEKFGGN